MCYKDVLNSILSLDKNVIITKFNQINNNVTVNVELEKRYQNCPFCNAKTNYRYDNRTRKINASKIYDKCINIYYKQYRYKCLCCNRKFIEQNNIVDKYSKLSKNCICMIHKHLTEKMSLTTIAKLNNTTPTTICNIINKLTKNNDYNNFPGIISIDEFKFSRSNHKYAFMIYDYLNKKIFRIIRNRQLNYLKNEINKYSKIARDNVKFVITDLWHPYKILTNECFKNALLVADKFHYTRCITNSLDKMRLKYMHMFNKKSKEYKLLKKHYKIYLLPIKKQTKNTLNILKEFFNISKELEIMYKTYNLFINICNHDYKSKNDIYTYINKFNRYLDNKNLTIFNEIKGELKNWTDEIVNSIYYKILSNGNIEGCNNLLKCIIRLGFGYKNIVNFEARAKLIHHGTMI